MNPAQSSPSCGHEGRMDVHLVLVEPVALLVADLPAITVMQIDPLLVERIRLEIAKLVISPAGQDHRQHE